MFTTPPVSPTQDSKPSVFENIYQTAKKPQAELTKLLSEIDQVDVRQGQWTPTSKLASEGYEDAVIILIQHGASVHEAGMGAAIGKKRNLAEKLRAKYGSHVNYIAKGAAIAGDYPYLDILLNQHGANLDIVVEGCAIAGDFPIIEKFRHSEHLNSRDHFELSVAKGLMAGGYYEEGLELQYVYDFDLEEILDGALMRGDMSFLEKIVKDHGLNETYLAKSAALNNNKEYCVKMADDDKWSTGTEYRKNVIVGLIEGCVISGNMPLLEHFDHIHLNKNNFAEHYIRAFFLTGPTSFQMKKVSQKFNYYHSTLTQIMLEFKSEFTTYALQHLDINYLLHLYNNMYFLSGWRQQLILDHVENFIINSGHFANAKLALHQLSYISDHEFLKSLKARESFPTYIAEIIPQAIKTNEVMNKYQIDFDQAQALLTHTKLRKLFLYLPFHLSDEFSIDIMVSIFMIFSPLSYASTVDMYNKISLATNKQFIEMDLKGYQQGYWIQHRDRASSFIKVTQEATERSDFVDLIGYQKKLFDKEVQPEKDASKAKHEQPLTGSVKDQYYEIITKHANRIR